MEEPVEFIDVRIENRGEEIRTLSVFSYLEFSFHDVPSDYQNYQMSYYCAGSRWRDGVVEYELKYEHEGYQFFTSDFEADGHDCVRESFIGRYRSAKDPAVVEQGACTGSEELGGIHCAALQKDLRLEPGQVARLRFFLGNGDAAEGRRIRSKYADPQSTDAEFAATRAYWDERLSKLQVETPDEGLNTLLNIWTLYQSAINLRFSRFSSFIEVGGRTGLGYRDTAQDAMCLPHCEPATTIRRIRELLMALTQEGYGLHLFDPAWFAEDGGEPAFKSPLIAPKPKATDFVHGVEDACSDDALWLIFTIVNYIKETGDFAFADERIRYAEGGEGTVYEHMKRILDFSAREVGAHGICKGLKADWNDCLNLGGGESALVSFLFVYAAEMFAGLAARLGCAEDAAHYKEQRDAMARVCEEVLWDGEWYIRGFTADGRKIGCAADEEGRVHLESNAWAVLSGTASHERAVSCMDAVYTHLFTEYGLLLNSPPYTKIDDGIGFVTRVYPGLKENGAIFSHPNPWAWAAEAHIGRGDRAHELYAALSPANQNDRIEVRQSEPYSFCQFITGKSHTAFGRARHPFMTGSAGWAYFALTQHLLGIRPDYDGLVVEPVLPKGWGEVRMTRVFRGATYRIHITQRRCGDERGRGGNADRLGRLSVNGKHAESIPVFPPGSEVDVALEILLE
jgi:N,N'-diacetylchitobiose phosphorylase